MGIFKKDELLLNFNGVKTENISSTIPYMNKLNADARALASKFNNKQLSSFTESENYDMYKLFENCTISSEDGFWIE